MIKHQKDFWAGILFMAFGIGAAVVAQENPLGTLSRMGPGYFPTALGIILGILGAALSVRALLTSRPSDASSRIEPVHPGVRLFILGSVAVYALTLLTLGLVVSIALLVVISSAAAGRLWARRLEVTVLCVFLCALCWAVFSQGIGLQVPVLPVGF